MASETITLRCLRLTVKACHTLLLESATAVLVSVPFVAMAQSVPAVSAEPSSESASSTRSAPPLEFSLSTTLSASNNGALAPRGFEQRDAFLSVRPGLSFGHVGSGLRIKGDLGVDLIASKNGTQEDGALPFAHLSAGATLVERLLFVDALVDVRQIEEEAFGARVEQGSTQNSGQASTLRVSPYLSSDLSPNLSFLARGDMAALRFGSDPSQDAQSSQLTLRLNSKPRTLGGFVEATTQDVHYPNAGANDWRDDMASIGPTVSFLASEIALGAVLGIERTTTTLANHTDSVAGGTLLWLPNQRTVVSLNATHRYFGYGWNATIQHRTPSVSLVFRAIREPLVPGAVLIGGGGALTTFLDSILTTRFPDASERQKLVSDLVATRGLRTAMQGTSGAPANYAQLGQGGEVTAVWLSTRNAASISMYRQTVTQLTRSDGELAFPGSGDQDNRQTGTTVQLNHRLTPLISADLTGQWSRIEGLSVNSGDLTRESIYRMSLARTLTPRSNLGLGVQYRQLRTNVVGQTSFDEASAFVSIGHRF